MNDNTQTPHPPQKTFAQVLASTWQTVRPVLARGLAWLWKQLQQTGRTLQERQQRPFTNRLHTPHLIRYWFWQLVSKWVYLLLALASFATAFVFLWTNPFDPYGFAFQRYTGSPVMGASFMIIGVNFCYHFWVLHTSSRPSDD